MAHNTSLDGNAKLCRTCYGGRKVYEYIGGPLDDTVYLSRLGLPVKPPVEERTYTFV